MQKLRFVLAWMLVVGSGLVSDAAAQAPQVGAPAPGFTLQASDGQTYTLSKLRGRTVVLAWFPKAFTSG